jgi:hypothetical protein
VIAWYIVHRDRRRSGEDRAETPEIFLVSIRGGNFKLEKGQEELEWTSAAEHALRNMHVGKAVVHHISEEDDCVWMPALRDAPGLAQIHVDEDPGHGPKERVASRVRPVIENLRIGDEEDVGRLFISLMTEVVRDKARVEKGEKRGSILLDLANDSVRLQRGRYRFQATRRARSMQFLWLSVNTLVPT